MRYAVLSDIHGNHPALLEVLKDARQRGIDHFILAGDYCLSGAWPDDCIKTIMDIPNKTIIRGNEERYLENLIGKDQTTWTDGQMQISYWCYRNIQADRLKYLLDQPKTTELTTNGVKINVAHSSEAFIGEYEFPHFGPAVIARDQELDIHEILDNDPVFSRKVNELEDGVYIFGHSHVQWSYKTDNVLLINPGSCGLPLDAIEDTIPYTILTIDDDGSTNIEEIRIPFDKKEYAISLKSTTQYAQANVWTKVITRELLTAREHLTFFLEFVEDFANKKNDSQRPYSVETWEEAYEEWSREL